MALHCWAKITNANTIEGAGTIINAVENTGTIESSGGSIIFTASLANDSGATLRLDSGAKLVAKSFATNTGLISLAGGTLDTAGHSLNNTGQIVGYGTVATGGLTNNGTFTLSG